MLPALRMTVFSVVVVLQLFAGCAANAYHRIVGTVGEIQAGPEVWEVQVFDQNGNDHRVRIPLRAANQSGYDADQLEQKIYSGTQVDVVTGPRQTVRRLMLIRDRTVLPPLAPLEISPAQDKDRTP